MSRRNRLTRDERVGAKVISFIIEHDLVTTDGPADFAWRANAMEQLGCYVREIMGDREPAEGPHEKR